MFKEWTLAILTRQYFTCIVLICALLIQIWILSAPFLPPFENPLRGFQTFQSGHYVDCLRIITFFSVQYTSSKQHNATFTICQHNFCRPDRLKNGGTALVQPPTLAMHAPCYIVQVNSLPCPGGGTYVRLTFDRTLPSAIMPMPILLALPSNPITIVIFNYCIGSFELLSSAITLKYLVSFLCNN